MMLHTVRQGECLARIALRYGVTAAKIWEQPENEHLRLANRSPDILFPGDEIRIPPVCTRTESVATGERHRYLRRDESKTRVRLRLLFEGQPRVDLPCTLSLDDLPGPVRTLEAITDVEGAVEFEVPLLAESGLLTLGDDEVHRIRFDHLDPVREVSGVQQRLLGLGFQVERTGTMDDQTRSALREFQRKTGAPETGALDTKTMESLELSYGS